MPPRAPSKVVPPKGNFWSRGFQTALIGAFLLAPVLGLLIQLSRAPDEKPLPVSAVKPRALGPFIAGLLASPKASDFECSLDEINVHLSQVLPPARKAKEGPAFQNLVLRLETGGCTVSAAYLWRGREWRLRLHYTVQIQGGRLRLQADFGSLGRVHLGPYWIKRMEAPLLKLLPHLRKEVVLLNRLENIRLEPTRVLLKVRASVPSPAP